MLRDGRVVARVGNEVLDEGRLYFANPDPFLPPGVLVGVRLRIGDVDIPHLVEHDIARHPELSPTVQIFPVLIEDHNALVAAVGNVDISGGRVPVEGVRDA